jgi:hypothetical protein
MAQPSRAQRFTAREVRAFMFGTSDDAVTVTRQARRLWPQDSDEILVARRHHDHWIARRLSDKITVWACMDGFSAEEQFERLADSRDGWVEARPVPTQRAG